MGKMGRLRTEARAARWDERMRELVEVARCGVVYDRMTLHRRLEDIGALLDLVDAARAVERGEALQVAEAWRTQAVANLRDALGRLEA